MSRTLRALILTLLFGTIPMHFPVSVASASADSVLIDPLLESTHIYIKSVNPGYKINGVAETGEAIELYNDADISLPLDGVTLRYYSSSGAVYTLFDFPEKSMMIGRTIVLRYEKSPEAMAADVGAEDTDEVDASGKVESGGDDRADADAGPNIGTDATYTKTIALTGSLELVYKAPDGEEKILSAVCWLGKNCNAKFNSSKPTALVYDEVEKIYKHTADYVPTFSNGLYLPPEEESSEPELENEESALKAPATKPQCLDLEFSEILSYYAESEKEQFVELYNPTDETIPLGGCMLRYKNKLYDLTTTNVSSENLTNESIGSDSYYVYRPAELKFTKNPNSENELALIDVTGDVAAMMKYPHGQKKATAYALISGEWQTTYYPTPGAPNVAQEFQTCPLGKVLNEATGNCVKPTAIASVKPCPAGKYRSPETGRCRNVDSDSDSEAKPCKDGYERNPETGRCRKIKENNGADYALVPVTGEDSKATSFIAIGALATVVALGVGYTLFQFRREIRYKFKKLVDKFPFLR